MCFGSNSEFNCRSSGALGQIQGSSIRQRRKHNSRGQPSDFFFFWDLRKHHLKLCSAAPSCFRAPWLHRAFYVTFTTESMGCCAADCVVLRRCTAVLRKAERQHCRAAADTDRVGANSVSHSGRLLTRVHYKRESYSFSNMFFIACMEVWIQPEAVFLSSFPSRDPSLTLLAFRVIIANNIKSLIT